MNYPFLSALIVPEAERETANALAAFITGGEPTAESDTYVVPLRSAAAGTPAEATHYGCCTVVSVPMLHRMEMALDSGQVSGVKFYRWDAVSSTLVSTNSPNAAAICGSSPWGWNASLADCGLEVIVDAVV